MDKSCYPVFAWIHLFLHLGDTKILSVIFVERLHEIDSVFNKASFACNPRSTPQYCRQVCRFPLRIRYLLDQLSMFPESLFFCHQDGAKLIVEGQTLFELLLLDQFDLEENQIYRIDAIRISHERKLLVLDIKPSDDIVKRAPQLEISGDLESTTIGQRVAVFGEFIITL